MHVSFVHDGNFTTTHFPAEGAVLSRCSFATTHLTACKALHSEIVSPLNFSTHETEDPFATPHKWETTKPSVYLLSMCVNQENVKF